MLKRTTIERSLEKYAGHKDPTFSERLALFGPLLLTAADIREALTPAVPQYADTEIKAALTQGQPLLTLGRYDIDPAAFLSALQKLSAVFMPGEKSVAWEKIATPELLQLAARTPDAFFARVEEVLGGDPQQLEAQVMPVVCYALRAFLDEVADEASREIAAVNSDATQFDEPLLCPVCGSVPALASVGETARNGSQKRLWCTCCGAHWVFERIRCVSCGSAVVSNFTYVHDDADSAHRLHVCRHCGEAFPTLFQSSLFSADVEAIVFTGLEEAYAQQHRASAKS